MSYPPSLTWMHLLPRELPLVTVGMPTWLNDGVTRHATVEQRHGGDTAAAVASVEAAIRSHRDVGSVVVRNPTHADAAALQAAGFSHVSRFAAMPNLRYARWFIPLGSRAAAAAAFCVYTPSKRSAILQRLAARTAARLGVRGWYADEVLIARRSVSPLEKLLHETLGRTDLYFALSAGAPEPALNRKCSVAAVSRLGEVLAFAKIAAGPLAESLVSNEHQVLRSLMSGTARGACVPVPLFGGHCAGSFTLIQRPLTGRPAGAHFTSSHAKFLRALQVGQNRPVAASRLVKKILDRGEHLGERAAALKPLLSDLALRGPQVQAPVTIVHGDFAPWNLLAGDSGLCAFDWEYGHEDGLPVLDETNHRLQVAHLIQHQTVEQACAMLTTVAQENEDFPTETVELLQNIGILDVATRLLTEGYGGTHNAMLDWYLALARCMAQRVPVPAVAA